MINKIINKAAKKKTILIVPLDWGLGHATRCIPLIQAFYANGCEVIIAGEGAVLSLLKHEFQQLTLLPVKGYRVSYTNKKKSLKLKIMAQLPCILLTIYKEHQWLKKVVKKYSIDAIVSDNRFGLFHSTLPSIYITHQLLIKTGGPFSERMGSKIHYWFISRFSQCWVPDFEGPKNIAGALSHPASLPANTLYIGGLSRFMAGPVVDKKYDLLVLLSGPEPQRTIFESMLLTQLQHFDGSVLFVRGLPGDNHIQKPALTNNTAVSIEQHLTATDLNQAILQASQIICRSGYTTIMDLLKLKRTAILVPTPGQTEQEYLAGHLMKQHLFYTVSQEEFVLSNALQKANDFPYVFSTFDMEQYKKEVTKFVQSL